MGASGTKEPPRNVTFENQIIVTEAAVQQLHASVGKGLPQATNTRTTGTDPAAPLKPSNATNNIPLPTIDMHGTVETWRALSSSVNDRELQRLREDYKQKLLEQDRNNREKFNLTKENFTAEVDRVEKKFSKFVYTPICEVERADIEKCYLANPGQVLTCSSLAEKFTKCVEHHREQSLSMSQQVISSKQREGAEQHTVADPSSAKVSAEANAH